MITYEQIAKILEGIDKEEVSDFNGWWETQTGAEFGASKLREIKALFDSQETYPFTFPCGVEEATELAEQIQAKLCGEWQGVGGIKDGVDLGLAARVIEAYRHNLTCKPVATH